MFNAGIIVGLIPHIALLTPSSGSILISTVLDLIYAFSIQFILFLPTILFLYFLALCLALICFILDQLIPILAIIANPAIFVESQTVRGNFVALAQLNILVGRTAYEVTTVSIIRFFETRIASVAHIQLIVEIIAWITRLGKALNTADKAIGEIREIVARGTFVGVSLIDHFVEGVGFHHCLGKDDFDIVILLFVDSDFELAAHHIDTTPTKRAQTIKGTIQLHICPRKSTWQVYLDSFFSVFGGVEGNNFIETSNVNESTLKVIVDIDFYLEDERRLCCAGRQNLKSELSARRYRS